MVRTIDNPLLIPKILDLAKNIGGTDLKTLEKMLIEGLTSKKSKILISEKNGEVCGFMYASIEEFEGEDVVFIQSAYNKPDSEERYTVFEFITKLRLWAKENNIRWIYTMTRRNIKPFIRKYKFQFYTNVLRLKAFKEEANE